MGNDTLSGGAGNNVYRFTNNWGSDTLVSTSGTDTVDLSAVTSNLAVTMWATSGNEVSDTVNTINWTTSNFENLIAGSGNDAITADNGNNLIYGGAGNDTIYGNNGNDTLIGGLGNDSLNGGANDDTYIFANGFGIDTLNDSSGNDTLDFTAETNAVTYNATSGTASARSDSLSWNTSTTAFEQILAAQAMIP